MIRLQIDEHICESEAGTSIIEVADRYGIHIPRFCYHAELSVSANCRMCLVEVSNSPRSVPACATPISDGLVVSTKSPKTQESQKAVLEFLLINHPLDCPVCDQGGECELQDLTMAHAQDRSRYNEEKRKVPNLNLGPLIATEMNRCIHCTRCIRFGSEIAGVKELGAFGRGEDTRVSNALNQNLRSSIAGNIIDLCPVGALTSKPHRYQGRTWQYQEAQAVSIHDMGRARLLAHTYHGQVRRMTSQGNQGSSDYWISDRDRFGFLGMEEDRLNLPMQWRSGRWEVLSEVECRNILDMISGYKYSWAGWFHPMSSEEEKLALQKYVEHSGQGLGTFDLLHRSIDLSCQKEWSLDNTQDILIVGGFWESQQPIALVHLRKWMEDEDCALTQLTFCTDSLAIERSIVACYGLDHWVDFVAEWIKKVGEKGEKKVFLHAQFLNGHLHILNEIISLCKHNGVYVYVLGQEAPLQEKESHFHSKELLSPDVVVTVHMEAQDFSQNHVLKHALDTSKALISFLAHQPEKGTKEGQIIIPISAPLEYQGTYKSAWEYAEVRIAQIVTPPKGVQSFTCLIEQWLGDAPMPDNNSISALLKTKTYIRTANLDLSCDRNKITLIVLQNPMSLNMILRRCKPLHETLGAIEKRGFWISSDLMETQNISERVSIKDNNGNIWEDSALLCSELSNNTIIYWSGLSSMEPCFGTYCSLEDK